MNENKNESSCQGVLLLLKNGYNWYIFVQFRGNLKTCSESAIYDEENTTFAEFGSAKCVRPPLYQLRLIILNQNLPHR